VVSVLSSGHTTGEHLNRGAACTILADRAALVNINLSSLCKGASRMVARKKIPSKVASKIPGNPAHPLYGRPILDVIKTGNVAQMKRMATTARKHVKEVQAALTKLDAQIKKAGTR
jgi:hypothetical protein